MAEEIFNVYKRIIWKVPNCSKESLASQELASCTDSPFFNISIGDNVTKWSMLFYPNGDSEDTKSHIGLFLNLESSTYGQFDASFSFGILASNGEKIYSGFHLKMSAEELREIPGYGQDKFIPHDDLFDVDSNYVHQSVLTLVCDMKLSWMKKSPPEPIADDADTSKYSDYQKMFECELFNDFELRTNDGKVLKAHKVILVARSPVFFAMLTTDMQESKENSTNVPDFDSKIMNEVLRFIYCNQVKNLKEIAHDLIYAAEKYQIEGLKAICLDSITSTLNIGNVIESLVISERVSKTGELFRKCVDLIVSNYRDVNLSKSLEKIPQDVLAKFSVEMLSRINTMQL